MSGPSRSSGRPAAPDGRVATRRPRFPAGLMAGLLPADVAVVDALDESFDGDRLIVAPAARDVAFPAELTALGDAGPHRRQEFARARICAHAAVAALGFPAEPILFGRQREPRWPTGLVGSLTHCPGYRAAVAARETGVLTVGLDAEPDRPLPAELRRVAFSDIDRAGSGPMTRNGSFDRVAFSARESVFKAWFQVTGRWLDFADATVMLRPDGPAGGDFTATIRPDVAGVQEWVQASGTTVLAGRFRREAAGGAPGLVLTAVTVRRRGPAADHAGRT